MNQKRVAGCVSMVTSKSPPKDPSCDGRDGAEPGTPGTASLWQVSRAKAKWFSLALDIAIVTHITHTCTPA